MKSGQFRHATELRQRQRDLIVDGVVTLLAVLVANPGPENTDCYCWARCKHLMSRLAKGLGYCAAGIHLISELACLLSHLFQDSL